VAADGCDSPLLMATCKGGPTKREARFELDHLSGEFRSQSICCDITVMLFL
jgi:hypothetical protein